MKKAIYSAAILFFLIGCYDNNPNRKQNIIDSNSMSQIDTNHIEQSKVKLDANAIAELTTKLNDLKSHFEYTGDEFDKIGWYQHKSQTVDNSFNRKCLIIHVNSKGNYYLEDQFYSEDWIFHTSIKVKVGDQIFESAKIETYNPNNKTQNGGQHVWESINYLDGGDNGIIEAIAQNVDSVVTVRFNGRQYYSDFTLQMKDKKAIKEGFELSELIKQLNE